MHAIGFKALPLFTLAAALVIAGCHSNQTQPQTADTSTAAQARLRGQIPQTSPPWPKPGLKRRIHHHAAGRATTPATTHPMNRNTAYSPMNTRKILRRRCPNTISRPAPVTDTSGLPATGTMLPRLLLGSRRMGSGSL